MAGGYPEPNHDSSLEGGLAGRTIHEAVLPERQSWRGLLRAYPVWGFPQFEAPFWSPYSRDHAFGKFHSPKDMIAVV